MKSNKGRTDRTGRVELATASRSTMGAGVSGEEPIGYLFKQGISRD